MTEIKIITQEQANQLKTLLDTIGIDLEAFLLVNNMKELVDKINSLEQENKDLKKQVENNKEHILYLEQKITKDATEQVFGAFTYNDNEDMSNV